VEHQAQLNKLEVDKSQALADIEAEKFKEIVDAISAKTIASIARAGPEMQARLLKDLVLRV